MKPLAEIVKRLAQEKPYLQETYAVLNLGVFGSVSRGEPSETSDIDIVVEFSKPIGLDFVDLADHLEAILGEKVDLVSRKAIRPNMWPVIQQEIVYV